MFTYGCTCLHMAVHVYITKDFLLSIHIVTCIAKYGYIMQHYIIMSIKAHAILLCCSLRQCIVSVLIKMLNMFNRYMVESTACHINEQIINSEECSELDTTYAAMVFNNGYVVMMDYSSMVNKKYSIYCYFSSTFEVAS